MPITAEHVAQYYQQGYVLVPDFLTPDELAAAQSEMRDYFPRWDANADAAAHSSASPATPFVDFPFTGDFLNRVSTHPDLVRFVQDVLGTSDVALHQSVLHGKHQGGPSDEEQALHVDYGNHTLTYPSAEPRFWEITTILYYTDVAEDSGPTYAVSWEHTRDEFLVPRVRSREEHPALYAHERPVTCAAGSLLIYNTRLFHRGSAFRAPGERVVQFIAYGPADARWMGYMSWALNAHTDGMIRFLEQATPAERERIGFPPPGHVYWTEETLAGVAARYPRMDMAPYRDAQSSNH